jgi:glutamate N-acetyltransferase/amino-acid N-acetyltransferase
MRCSSHAVLWLPKTLYRTEAHEITLRIVGTGDTFNESQEEETMRIIEGSIATPTGFRAQGVACGLKKNGGPDLALVVCDVPATACGVFTRNLVKGHSLQRTQRLLPSSSARAVVVNSGNANACVGARGDSDAEEMGSLVAKALGIPPEAVLTGSTGVIGMVLDMGKVAAGICAAASSLATGTEAGHRAEAAIMTTDLVPKEACVSFEAGGATVLLAGMAKGSGMIHPDMATMISVVTTDALVSPALLSEALGSVTGRTFNRVSVDGDTSVCDMVVALASGLAGNRIIDTLDSEDGKAFLEALEAVCTHLAREIARDGEGATKLIEVRCEGAETPEDAYKVVLAVAKSPLVKTAFFGEDANWGRILTAAGYSGASFDPATTDIHLGGLQVCASGTALPFDESEAKRILSERSVTVTLRLGAGAFSDRIWTCDFTYDYVKINGSYRS